MLRVRYSLLAEADLIDIGVFTRATWNEAQADRYLEAIERCCERLAAYPMLGRDCGNIRAGLRRMECESHVMFYEVGKVEIIVARVLHKRRLPGLHVI